MMLVDSSVWIGDFNGTATSQTHFLRDMLDRDEILVSDLILCEALQGFRHDKHVAAAREKTERDATKRTREAERASLW